MDSRYYDRANYEALYKINSSYAAKYVKKEERNKLLALLNTYRSVCRYTKKSADTVCIMSYYNHKIEENGVNPRPYKLFYVGCSRARKKLLVVIEETKINKFKEAFITKARTIGFDDKDVNYTV